MYNYLNCSGLKYCYGRAFEYLCKNLIVPVPTIATLYFPIMPISFNLALNVHLQRNHFLSSDIFTTVIFERLHLSFDYCQAFNHFCRIWGNPFLLVLLLLIFPKKLNFFSLFRFIDYFRCFWFFVILEYF